jgi:hypothetical protein
VNRSTAIVGVLLLAVLGIVLLSPGGPRRSPEHRSDSDAPDGASALYTFAERLGHPVSRLTTSYAPPAGPGLLFVFSPVIDVSPAQAAALESWLRGGGTLVYADESGTPALDAVLGLTRPRGVAFQDGVVRAVGPFLQGVSSLRSSPCCAFGPLPPAQVPILRGDIGVLGAVRTIGEGLVVSLSDPLELCNERIGAGDNNRMAADLLGLVPAGTPVFFDEFHHGAGRASASALDWATTSWGAALAWGLLIVYGGFLLRGRAFGPRIPIRSTRDRSSAEFASAVGALLRRTGAHALTRRLLVDATRQAVAERSGLGVTPGADRLDEALRQRAPDLADRLSDAAAPGPGGESEEALLDSARRLHDLAYPSPRNNDRL